MEDKDIKFLKLLASVLDDLERDKLDGKNRVGHRSIRILSQDLQSMIKSYEEKIQ